MTPSPRAPSWAARSTVIEPIWFLEQQAVAGLLVDGLGDDAGCHRQIIPDNLHFITGAVVIFVQLSQSS